MASKRPSDEFDEYEYLEKMVEEQGDTKKKKKDGGDAPAEKNDRGYRKKEADREDNDDEEGRSSRKRSRGRVEEDDDDRRDRDKDRRRSSRDRDRDRERDRERDGERSSKEREKERDREKKEREREKEKERERERERERDRREREKERERRDREKEKEKEKERERRERSSSRPRRHDSDRDKEWEKEKERELENKESRRFRDKKEAVEPEADPERDQRTVFAYQMPLKATERDVFDFFSKAGRVRDVRLIMDRNSRRSKGVGYIEFYDVMSVPMAIALSGQLLFGQPVMVKPSEAEKNLVQSTTATGSGGVTGPYGAVDRKLYVGNLHFNMTEVQLRQIFEAFGPVELVQLPLDLETGQCKGFGFVQFARLEDAKAAQSALNGKLDIAGRFIKVSSVTDHVGTQDSTAKSADFDDDEGGGLALNAQSRAILMQKLDRSGIATSIAGPLGVPMLNGQAPQQTISLPTNGQAAYPTPNLPMPIMATAPVVDPIGQPSECLLLKNMFDASTEAEPDFDLDIKEDVEEECSKYGRVKHIYVDKNSAGLVYLRFDSVDGAARAQKAMHMRWFARRSISAVFMRPQEYEAKFGG